MLLTDTPIAREEDDKLGTMTFVRRLVEPLVGAPPTQSLVVGLYGPWGNGKSSALNLLELALHEKTEGVRSITVRFNPWLYRDAESLLLSFFGTLTTAIGGAAIAKKTKETIRQGLAAIAGFATPIMKVSPIPSVVTSAVEGTFAGAQKLLESGETDYKAKKAAVAKALSELGSRPRPLRVVVLIDDLDRSGAAEVEAMLRLVKLIADLPNVSYVLSMDDQRVREIVGGLKGAEYGADYLEKIVQVSVNIPPVRPEKLREILLEGVIAELHAVELDGSALTRGQYEGGVEYDRVFGKRVKTLRDVARFVNSLRFVLRTGESPLDLNDVDVVLLCFLQTFYPAVYGALRTDKKFLLGRRDGFEGLFGDDKQKTQAREKRQSRFDALASGGVRSINESIRVADDVEVVSHVLRTLFPNAVTGLDREDEQARSTNRICSPDRFDLYFQLSSPPDEVPDADVLNAIGALSDNEAKIDPADILRPFFDGATEGAQDSFFQKLTDRIELIDRERAADVVRGAIALESVMGLQRVVSMSLDLVRRSQMLADILEPPDEQPAVLIPRLLIEQLSDAPAAIDLASDLISDRTRDIRLTSDAKAVVVRAGLKRAEDYFEATPDVFFALEGWSPNEAIHDWARLLRASDGTLGPVRAYLAKLLDASPERLSDVLALASVWAITTPPFPYFDPSRDMTEVSKILGDVVDLERITKMAKEQVEARSGRYPHLVADFAGFADNPAYVPSGRKSRSSRKAPTSAG